MHLIVFLLVILAIAMALFIYKSKRDVCISCVLILFAVSVFVIAAAIVNVMPWWFYTVGGSMYVAFFIILGARMRWVIDWPKVFASATITAVSTAVSYAVIR